MATLRGTLSTLRTLIFNEIIPISQYLLLKSPSALIKHISLPFDAQDTAIEKLRSIRKELVDIQEKSGKELSKDENICLKSNIISLQYIIDDYAVGFKPYLSENFISGVYSQFWQYAVIEGKINNSMEDGRSCLLHVYTITVSWLNDLIKMWKKGIEKNLIMTQGAVEQTIIDIKGKYAEEGISDIKESKYYKLLNSEKEDLNAIDTIKRMLIAWANVIHFLENEYLPVAKRFRPYDNVKLDDKIYFHMINHTTTRFDDPKATAALGRKLIQEIEDRMLLIGKRKYGLGTFKEVCDMLLDKNNEHSHLLQMNGEKVITYLKEMSEEISQAVKKEFVLPNCGFDIKLFESAGIAYYVSGRVDNSKEPGQEGYCLEKGVPTVDPGAYFSYEKDDMSLLIHESVPAKGHHLQQQIAVENNFLYEIEGEGLQSAITQSQTGYIEGWALYAESVGFNLNLYGNEMRELRHHNNNMLRAVRLVVDSELNTGKMTRNEAVRFMMEKGFSKDYSEFEVDRYTAYPAQALGYMRGCIFFKEQRRKAESMMRQFDAKQFHKVILESGTISLGLVEEKIDEWIRSSNK